MGPEVWEHMTLRMALFVHGWLVTDLKVRVLQFYYSAVWLNSVRASSSILLM